VTSLQGHLVDSCMNDPSVFHQLAQSIVTITDGAMLKDGSMKGFLESLRDDESIKLSILSEHLTDNLVSIMELHKKMANPDQLDRSFVQWAIQHSLDRYCKSGEDYPHDLALWLYSLDPIHFDLTFNTCASSFLSQENYELLGSCLRLFVNVWRSIDAFVVSQKSDSRGLSYGLGITITSIVLKSKGKVRACKIFAELIRHELQPYSRIMDTVLNLVTAFLLKANFSEKHLVRNPYSLNDLLSAISVLLPLIDAVGYRPQSNVLIQMQDIPEYYGVVDKDIDETTSFLALFIFVAESVMYHFPENVQKSFSDVVLSICHVCNPSQKSETRCILEFFDHYIVKKPQFIHIMTPAAICILKRLDNALTSFFSKEIQTLFEHLLQNMHLTDPVYWEDVWQLQRICIEDSQESLENLKKAWNMAIQCADIFQNSAVGLYMCQILSYALQKAESRPEGKDKIPIGVYNDALFEMSGKICQHVQNANHVQDSLVEPFSLLFAKVPQILTISIIDALTKSTVCNNPQVEIAFLTTLLNNSEFHMVDNILKLYRITRNESSKLYLQSLNNVVL
jgi:hypothetical protein